jgi:hypothetical protein
MKYYQSAGPAQRVFALAQMALEAVLRPGGEASILDLRKDANREDIDNEVRKMRLSALEALITRWIFRFFLVKRAYTREQLEQLATQSYFGRCEIIPSGIGFQLRLTKAAVTRS